MWYVHTTESYSTIKRNEVLTDRYYNMDDLENMLNESSQSQKSIYYDASHMKV